MSMIKCSCPKCACGFTVEIDYFAMARARGEAPEIFTGRFSYALANKNPVNVNVKCPKCAVICDLSAAYVSSSVF